MSSLKSILASYRVTSQTEREKGSYFEELIRTYSRYIVTTTNDWSENASDSLHQQQPPVYKIDLLALETSQIDWGKYQPSATPALKPKKQLRPHQTSARTNVLLGYKSADRGKLIMACGTGKTFTSLKIAEEVAGKNKRVLFLVLCSMDDEAIYGKQLHVITFSEAVQLKLLTDYKVIVLTIDEAHVSARINGCWKTLSKKGLAENLSGDSDPMRRAVRFFRPHGKVRDLPRPNTSGRRAILQKQQIPQERFSKYARLPHRVREGPNCRFV